MTDGEVKHSGDAAAVCVGVVTLQHVIITPVTAGIVRPQCLQRETLFKPRADDKDDPHYTLERLGFFWWGCKF